MEPHRYRNGDRGKWESRGNMLRASEEVRSTGVREIILEKGRKEYGGMGKVRGAQYGGKV